MNELLNNIESLRDFLKLHPEHAPIVPDGPGLGLGGRMGSLASTSAMLSIEQLGIRASAIQCSVFRELIPEVLKNQIILTEYKGIGQIPIGHTGMTIQGQFLSALRDRIKKDIKVPYVADADHIPLYGDTEENIKQFAALISEACDRTLFTIDPHFCIHENTASPKVKFFTALAAIKRAAEIIAKVKGDNPYRIEVSIDECIGLTTETELSFLTKELVRMKIPLFSIAPAIGFDKKDKDVSPEQSGNFSKMLKTFHQIVNDNGLLLGIHSGDGKSARTQQLIAESTESQVWYKVSPDRQRLFLKLLSESPQNSDEQRLFVEMLEYLQGVLKDKSCTFTAQVKTNALEYITQYNTKKQSENTANLESLYDIGFLLAKPFADRFANLSTGFEKQYTAMDNLYITDLAKNLGLINATY